MKRTFLSSSLANASGDLPSPEFVSLLKACQTLKFSERPDYDGIASSFESLARRKGYSLTGPIDWKPADRPPLPPSFTISEPDVEIGDSGDQNDEDEYGDVGDYGSYFG